MNKTTGFAAELAALFARDLARLGQQIEAFPDSARLWHTLPGITNSAGNLALHLEGNLREYIGRQLGSLQFVRDRPAEFALSGVSREELGARVAALRESIPAVVASLSHEALDSRFPEDVLGVPLSTRQFLMHLSGHFNYHLGQIDYLRRALTSDSAIPLARL